MPRAGRFSTFSSQWPLGWSQLASELEARGFRIESLSSGLKKKALDSLSVPHGASHLNPNPSSFCYLSGKTKLASEAGWGLVLVDSEYKLPLSDSLPWVRLSFVEAATDFLVQRLCPAEWSSGTKSEVYPEASKKNIILEPSAHLGPDVEIGEGSIIETGVRLGARVKIGKGCRIGAYSRISDDSELGEGCQLSAHVCVGAQGFGLIQYPAENFKRPRRHVGRVIIGRGVRLGAFVSIDRGVFEDTLLGDHVAIDNHVQIAHNCQVGTSSLLCSFVGLSGSTTLGEGVTMAGQSGTVSHVHIGKGATVGGQTGINRDILDGEFVKGYPPRPLRQALELESYFSRLPELFKKVRKLEKLESEGPPNDIE